MKNIFYVVFAFIASVQFTSCGSPDSDKAQTTEAQKVETTAAGATYIVNTDASTIEWIGTKVSGYHTGPIKIKSGELQVSDGNITGGTFVMDMTTIAATGPKEAKVEANAKLTGHLKSADFFDVEKFPEATFTITEVKAFSGKVDDPDDPRQETLSKYKVSDSTHSISGNLTIKDISKNITFPAKVTITDNAVDAIAKFNIDRTEWNITYEGKPDDLIRKEIHLGVSLKATKATPSS